VPLDDASPLGLRLLLADRYRVDARLLAPGSRVDAVDTHAAGGRRVRVACLELDGPGDGATARLAAWADAHAAGLPVSRPLDALDEEPGPLVVLEPPPPGVIAGDPAGLAAQARVLAGALAERGLRAGAIPALDLALDAAGALVLAAPPPIAAVVDARAEAERLAATIVAAASVAGAGPPPAQTPPPGTSSGLRRHGRRLMGRPAIVRGCAVAAAAAAVLVLVGSGLRDDAPVTDAPTETAPASVQRPAPPALRAPALDGLPPLPLRETVSSRARPRTLVVRRQPPRGAPARPDGGVAPPAPAAAPDAAPAPVAAPPPVPGPPRPPILRSRPAPGWALGPESPLGPAGAGRR
jgi:hypothetical protein